MPRSLVIAEVYLCASPTQQTARDVGQGSSKYHYGNAFIKSHRTCFVFDEPTQRISWFLTLEVYFKLKIAGFFVENVRGNVAIFFVVKRDNNISFAHARDTKNNTQFFE